MKTLDSSSDDRLSELPDSLILEILSLMPMSDVVRTTILSKRWKDLWTSVPCLEFELHAKTNPARDRNLICQVLQRWKGINVRTFSIAVMTAFDGLQSDMDLWIRFATVKKVEKFYLFLPFDRYNPHLEYYLPQLVYSCSSFKELWISGCNLETIQEKVQWYNLETLYLNGSSFSEDVINQVVSSAPRLEVFHLRLTRSHHNLNIASTSLKRLSVEKFNVDTAEYDPSRYATLMIRAPKLECLRLVGNPYSECVLLMNASSLTRASLCFYEDRHCAALQETLMQILPSIQLVESLTLSPCAFKMLGVMQAKYSFPNVKKLKLDGGPITPKEIAGLAQLFPQVETLVIDWKLDDEWWYPSFLKNLSLTTYKDSEAKPCSLKQLRAVEIITYSDSESDPSEFQLILNFLREHATMLHKTVIRKEVEELCSWVKQCNALIDGS